MKNSSSFKRGYAKVTSKGIIFRGIRFSCLKAVREQWFEKAKVKRRWRIKVYYSKVDLSKIFIRNCEGEFEACNSINESAYPGSKLEAYFNALQMLKEERKRVSSTRRNRKRGGKNGRINSRSEANYSKL